MPETILGNLDNPESETTVPLNFKVPPAFKREFKTYAAQQGRSMSRILMEAFAFHKERTK